MRRFIFSTILGAALLGLLTVPTQAYAQRMMQMSPPVRTQPPVRMQSPSFAPQGFSPVPHMSAQYPMSAYQMPSNGYPTSGYQMSSDQTPSYQGSSYDSDGSPYGSYGSSQYPSSNSQASQVAVGVYDDLYQSSSIRIAVGTTVVWQNYGRHHHTVTSDDGTWSSDELGAEAAYEHTFSQPGIYHYYCRLHTRAMRGTIEVR